MKFLFSIFIFFSVQFFIFSKNVEAESGLLKPLIEIQSNGRGNESASLAWKKIANLPPSSIPKLLHAMNQANELGDNWIRAAISKITERPNVSLPINKIISFLNDQKNDGDSRQQAFYIIQTYQPERANELIPTFINDPVLSLRRVAVAEKIRYAKEETNKQKRIEILNGVLKKARDADQIKEITESMNTDGIQTDLVELMGFFVNWKAIGPFDNSERKGFEKKYPPEDNINYNEKYEGKNGQVSWSSFETSHELGLLDINLQFGELKEVVAYAHTQVDSELNQDVQFRIGSKNAWKLWVNNELIFARDEYHRGKTRVDQFVISGKLKKGSNDVLLKICQNEQTQSWTKQWEFNFRITDLTGTPLPSSK